MPRLDFLFRERKPPRFAPCLQCVARDLPCARAESFEEPCPRCVRNGDECIVPRVWPVKDVETQEDLFRASYDGAGYAKVPERWHRQGSERMPDLVAEEKMRAAELMGEKYEWVGGKAGFVRVKRDAFALPAYEIDHDNGGKKIPRQR